MRCYDGCPDDELQAILNRQSKLLHELQKLDSEASVTYFPMEQRWQAHIWGNPISGMHIDKADAIQEAIQNLIK